MYLNDPCASELTLSFSFTLFKTSLSHCLVPQQAKSSTLEARIPSNCPILTRETTRCHIVRALHQV